LERVQQIPRRLIFFILSRRVPQPLRSIRDSPIRRCFCRGRSIPRRKGSRDGRSRRIRERRRSQGQGEKKAGQRENAPTPAGMSNPRCDNPSPSGGPHVSNPSTRKSPLWCKPSLSGIQKLQG
jgi:hypothetical protein